MQWLRTKLNFYPFWLTLLVPLLIGVTLHWSMKKLITTTHRVTHAHQVLEELDDIPLQLGRAHSAHHDYVLTGDEQYLTSYQTAAHATQKEIEDVRQFIKEDKGQQKRLAAVEDLAHERLSQLQQTILLRKTDGFDAALQTIIVDDSTDLPGHIDALIQEMEKETWRLLASWSTATDASAHQLDALIAGGSVMALLLLIVANFLILWHAVERTQAETARRASAERYQSLFESAHDGIVLVIRSRRPFFQSRPGKYLLLATLLSAGITLIFPFTPLGRIFGFQPLPVSILFVLGIIVGLYILAAEVTKGIFYKNGLGR